MTISKRALIVVDIQNDYFPAGKMPLYETEKAAKKAKIVIDRCRELNIPVIFIQHFSLYPNARFFLPGTQGADINALVAPKDNEKLIKKHYPNSFRETELSDYLKELKVEELILIGMMTQMCIDTTTRAGFDLGYKCTVIEDACTCPDMVFNDIKIQAKDVHYAFMAALGTVFATITDTNFFIKNNL